jgi:pimeloyl-ACP methyl ester carboxylesterase
VSARPTGSTFRLPGEPELHLRLQPAQRAHVSHPRGAALYVHGATFPSALSLFFRFDGRSWADALNDAGFDAWGLDFAGYGESQRDAAVLQPSPDGSPPGRADAVELQLARAMRAVAQHSALPLHLIAHSWGSIAALRCAGDPVLRCASLVLFGPVACRESAAPAARAAPDAELPLPPTQLLTAWAQHRRFVTGVPPGEPPVLDDAHMDAWARAYLASDPQAQSRMPPAVCVPNGPSADIAALWSGVPQYDAARVRMPTLLVYGEWDSVFDDRDAARLAAELRNAPVTTRRLPRGTHLMHLESGRHALHAAVNEFLLAQPRADDPA